MITITALPSRIINIGRLPDMTPEPEGATDNG